MNKKKSIKLNFVMNALLNMSSFIFPLITFPYVSRILLPEGTGRVNFATSFIAYFTMFASLLMEYVHVQLYVITKKLLVKLLMSYCLLIL